jgi:RND family efflux transporter MFP subunit
MYQNSPGFRKYEVRPKVWEPPVRSLSVVRQTLSEDASEDAKAQSWHQRARQWWYVPAVLVGLIIAFMYWRVAPLAVETTVVVTAYPSQARAVLHATGYVQAERKAAVASKGSGPLEWLGVAEGSIVKKDQIIARLESRDVNAALATARANVRVALAKIESARATLTDAQLALKRAEDLAPRGAISVMTMDEAVGRERRGRAELASAVASHEAALANVQSAQVAVDYTNIQAPFDGVVLSRAANIGDIVTPMSSAVDAKGAVVTIADMSTLEVEADVSEASLGSVHVDQPCEILLDALPDRRFRGMVGRIVPTLDRAKATVMTKVRFIDTDPRVLPEMSAKVTFLSRPVTPEEQQPVTAVDPRAIVERAGETLVYAVRNNRAVQISVEKGEAIGDLVQIKGWLMHQGEDLVVLNPSSRIRSGVAVIAAAVK